ncbi:MAG: hypothetical protein KJ592_03500, partial [Nanoarchaeota archaeon]|nr:hypothetical protein [Nanoarchaeota archaeon]
MRDDKFSVVAMGVFVFGVFVFVAVYSGFDLGLTGYAIFGGDSEGDFGNGSYVNTGWNGSAIVLLGDNLSGSYTSEVFDAGAGAVWNNLSWNKIEPSLDYIYGVDADGAIYRSGDEGVNWILIENNYGRGGATQGMFSDDIYLYIIVGGAREVWRSLDGESWEVVNDGFNKDLKEGEVDSNNKIYVIGGDGTVWQSVDSGVSWNVKGDFNADASNNAKGSCMDSSDNFYVTDGSKGVFLSSDEGVTWFGKTADYGDGAADDIACLGSDLYIIKDKKVWRSVDSGISWVKINDNAFDAKGLRIDSFNGILYVLDTKGKFYNSSDGVMWSQIGDMNSGDKDSKGLTEFIQSANLDLYVRSCDDNVCSGESWNELIGDSHLDLEVGNNRYFQYRVDFMSFDSSMSPGLESLFVDYDLLNSAPSVILISPQDGASYGYNESLSLEFSVFDAEDNLDSCWYNLNGGENISLADCFNISFDVSGDGVYILNVYADDSFGAEGSDGASFSVQAGAPSIVLNSPFDVYLSSGNVTFIYSPEDSDLEVCELWGDFSGEFVMNQIDEAVSSGIENEFYLELEDGVYVWNVACNDSVGHSATNGNKSFTVDSVAPSLDIIEPVGIKALRNVDLEFSVSDDSSVSCWYNVFRGGSLEISNTSVDCSGVGSFSVTVDADFVLNLFVSDSAGNLNFDSSGFSVDSSEASVVVVPASSNSGSSGGGSFSASLIVSSGVLQVEPIDVILSLGEEKILVVSVKNKGKVAANKCSLVGGEYVESVDVSNIGVGEIVEFGFVLSALDSGVADLKLKIECLDGVFADVPLNVVILELDLDVSIEEIGYASKDEILIKYSVEPTDSYSRVLFFRVFNSAGGLVAEVLEEVELVFGEVYEGEILIDVADVDEGMLKI